MGQHVKSNNVSKQFCCKRSWITSLKLQTKCQKAINKYFFLNFYGPNDTFDEAKTFSDVVTSQIFEEPYCICVPSVYNKSFIRGEQDMEMRKNVNLRAVQLAVK